MAELVDALDSKSGFRKGVQVRFLFWALDYQLIRKIRFCGSFLFAHSLHTEFSRDVKELNYKITNFCQNSTGAISLPKRL